MLKVRPTPKTNFDIILQDWQALKPALLSLDQMTNVQLLDEFCFFAAERAEARGRNSAYNDKHLIRLFAELKRRNLFPE